MDLKKVIEYSMKELSSSEDYNNMAHYADDATMAQKFNEMAKEEMKHYDYLRSILDKEKAKESNSKDMFCYKFVDTYEESLNDWKNRIMYKINTFQFK